MNAYSVMNSSVARALTVAACLWLTACAELQTLLPESRTTTPPLAYYAWLQAADEAELIRENARLSAPDVNPSTDITLIQRALLHSVPASATAAEHNTALELLAVALERPDDAPTPSSLQSEYAAFAGIWLNLLEQQREYRFAREHQQNDQERIRELSVKVDRLEKQITALTTIEQRLIEREQTQGQP